MSNFWGLKVPAWLICFIGVVFVGVILERLYIAKVAVKIWGIELNQPAQPRTNPTVWGGSTKEGNTHWEKYPEPDDPGVFVDVDTSAAGFKKTPFYVISIQGGSRQWSLTGTSTVYEPTNKSFRVYLRYPAGNTNPINPAEANARGWHVVWVAVGDGE